MLFNSLINRILYFTQFGGGGLFCFGWVVGGLGGVVFCLGFFFRLVGFFGGA